MRVQTLGENWDALLVAVVSPDFYTSEQAFMALQHGAFAPQDEFDRPRPGRRKMSIDYKLVLKLKQTMTWVEIGRLLGIKERTLSRRMMKYIKAQK